MANTDFPLNEWRAAGLNVPSGVKAQFATVEERLVVKVVGQLAGKDVQVLNAQLRKWLKL
jgi:phosphoribosylamine-glycine ligase